MAQMVARDVWDVDAAGSNPVTPTKKRRRAMLRLCFLFGVRGYRIETSKEATLLLAVRPLAVVCGAEGESCHSDQKKTVILIQNYSLF